MRALSVLLLVVALLAAPVSARPASAVAHGEDVDDGAWAFSALLTMTGLPAEGGGRRDSWCSGALIDPRWVITAGHCFRTADGRRVSRTVAEHTAVIVGRADLASRDGVEAGVAAVHQAEDADVALVELDAPVHGITPLRVGGTPPAPGEQVRLTGYGLTSSDESATVERLQTGRFVVGPYDDSLVETSGTTPREETSPCPHDSGGPYFREPEGGEPELVAVVSTGPGCPHPGPDFSARTDNLTGWIADTMAGRGPVRTLLHAGAGFVVLAAVLAAALTAARRRRTAGLDRAAH